MKVLFICNQNKHRSKTAEELFKEEFETKSAGLFNEYPVSEEELSWADLVIVMEDFQKTEISKRFPEMYLQKRILSLNIHDIYGYNQLELIEVLKEGMGEIGILMNEDMMEAIEESEEAERKGVKSWELKTHL